MNTKEIQKVDPSNLGWLEYKLNSQEMDYVWRCIENKKEDKKKQLAGNISSSYSLMDRGDWFFTNVCNPLILISGSPLSLLNIVVFKNSKSCLGS